jgi:hypothetical protein
VSAVAKLLDRRDRLRRGLKALGASGQLGYRIPEKSLAAGLERAPDYIGADLGSIDPGPYYLGNGELATAPGHDPRRPDPASARRAQARHPAPDRHRRLGGCGAASRKDARHVRDIARADRLLRFRLASILADMPRQLVREAVRSGRVAPDSTAWRRSARPT